ncbi:MAG TPA: inositol monophosphatase family protein [Thermoanaerobaculia bacterium]|nr:inositol monophosphatase family protein [Thermoanaerobaculia bacterium]
MLLCRGLNDDLALALSLADAADAITMRFFRSASLAVRTKSDRTPVSEADEAVETMIREMLARERPDDGIVGEEFGTSSGTRRWILDPIDGTKNYVRGVPVFGTLIALENEVGVVSAPALHQRWSAVRGHGAYANGQRIHASRIERIEDATISYDSIHDFDKHGSTDKFVKLVRRCSRSRAFGDFWAHMLVAEGGIDIAIEPQVAHWDMAAIQIIVDEAGGRFTALDGQPRADAGSGVSTNGILHDEVLRSLR